MIVAGVDCHRDTHSIVFLDEVGRALGSLTIPALPSGYSEALRYATPYGNVTWGLEGTGSYGRTFADALIQAGQVVYEVPGAFTKRHRKQSSSRGKSDIADARAIAEAVLREAERLPRYRRSDEQEATRLLYDRRDRLVRQRTEAINRVRSDALRLGMEDPPGSLKTAAAIRRLRGRIAKLRGTSRTAEALIGELREAAEDIGRLNSLILSIEKQLRPFVDVLAPELLGLRGVSVVVAAGLIGHSGSVDNIRSPGAFAMRAGVAPVQCSSGRSQAVRLNAGGDRQLNRCLHVIALAQVHSQQHAGQVYYNRKRNEGMSHRAALRALKRHLATVVYLRLKASSGLRAA